MVQQWARMVTSPIIFNADPNLDFIEVECAKGASRCHSSHSGDKKGGPKMPPDCVIICDLIDSLCRALLWIDLAEQ